uniref:Small integral membrane protein 20-like n=1 Tax=Cyprinus carpio TaxID=7962 RepID=A0A8C2CDM6_CYPCA
MSANRRITLIFGGFVAAVAVAFYPIFFHPLTHTEDYKQIQKVNRAGINQADVQPAGKSLSHLSSVLSLLCYHCKHTCDISYLMYKIYRIIKWQDYVFSDTVYLH